MSVLPPLRIRVRLFAMQREIAGHAGAAPRGAAGPTVDDAWAAVVEAVPALAPGRPSLRFAVNGDYADPDRPLADGDEIACIPPVSGGSGEAEAATPTRRAGSSRSAPAPFGGRPRPPSSPTAWPRTRTAAWSRSWAGPAYARDAGAGPGGRGGAPRRAGAVEALDYEAFEPMALAVLGEIADEIEARFGVRRLAIVHRTGEVPLGEASVVVVAVAPHRDAAFEAARYAIDETKARAPIWKAERFADGHVWIGHAGADGPGGARRAG